MLQLNIESGMVGLEHILSFFFHVRESRNSLIAIVFLPSSTFCAKILANPKNPEREYPFNLSPDFALYFGQI